MYIYCSNHSVEQFLKRKPIDFPSIEDCLFEIFLGKSIEVIEQTQFTKQSLYNERVPKTHKTRIGNLVFVFSEKCESLVTVVINKGKFRKRRTKVIEKIIKEKTMKEYDFLVYRGTLVDCVVMNINNKNDSSFLPGEELKRLIVNLVLEPFKDNGIMKDIRETFNYNYIDSEWCFPQSERAIKFMEEREDEIPHISDCLDFTYEVWK